MSRSRWFVTARVIDLLWSERHPTSDSLLDKIHSSLVSLPTPKPHKLASRWLARLITPAAAVMAVLVGGLRAQSAPADASPKVLPTPSLQSMGKALRSQDYTVEQLRRFRRPGGAVVTVRERLQVDANGTKDPLFELTFLGVEGEPAGSPLSLEWQQTYARYGSLFVRNGSFHVRDLPRASSNYTLATRLYRLSGNTQTCKFFMLMIILLGYQTRRIR